MAIARKAYSGSASVSSIRVSSADVNVESSDLWGFAIDENGDLWYV